MADITKLSADKSRYNRLINEKSPYLLQHAANPVDWYPWSDEAFEKARKEDKPIFLSIGYSTCHWCHVMENESFQDIHIAEVMNDTFVSIKVDREERPDIDNIYMTACQMITGSGGWPLTIIMTPDKKPFYVGTYIPREGRFGMIGLSELVPRIREIWKTRRDEISETADQITEALLRAAPTVSSDSELGEPILKSAYEQFEQSFDKRFAGFGGAPKFPTPHNFLFLLRYWKRAAENPALEMVESTLRAMRQGGIYDHLGFGFHRYSTDIQWLVPHFEKMLYDQALITLACIETYQATGGEEFKETAREIFIYIMRDMTDPEGGFYSAEDADSEDQEGKFYFWRADEIRKALKPDDAELTLKVYNIKDEGNLEDQARQLIGLNILHVSKPFSEIATDLKIPMDELSKRLEKIRVKLFEMRNKRVHPLRDDKILTDWNGLMVAALALGGQVFDEPLYIEAARKAVGFIMGNMRGPDGRLYHRFRDHEAAMQATVDDYSFLIWGLLNLYEATFDIRYLRDALELNGDLIDHYWDKHEGGFFFTADDAEKLPVRRKELFDTAVPSGNSISALNLLRLGRITGNLDYDAQAEKTINLSSGQVRQAPQAFTMLLCALDFDLGPSYEIVIVGRPSADDTRLMLQTVRSRFIPNKIVIVKPAGHDSPDIVHFADFIKHQSSLGGKATAYICRNYSCYLPTNDAGELAELLDKKSEI